MCNSIFIGCFCVVFHCNTYELYRSFSIQIVIHIGLMGVIANVQGIVIVNRSLYYTSYGYRLWCNIC